MAALAMVVVRVIVAVVMSVVVFFQEVGVNIQLGVQVLLLTNEI